MDNLIERIPNTQLFVEPVQRPSVQNRHLQEGRVWDGNKVVSKGPAGKIKATVAGGRSCIDSIVFKVDDSGTRLIAGMGHPVSPNPFKDLDPETVISSYNLSSKWRDIVEKIVKQESVTTQQYLEILAGVEPDTYTERLSSRRVGQFCDPNVEKTVLESMEIKLYDQINVYSSSSPKGRLEMQLIKMRSDKIPPSRDLIDSSRHNFYVARENEQYIVSKKKNDLVNEAIAAYVNLQKKYPASVLYQLASVLPDSEGRVIVKGETSQLHVEEAVNAYIKTTDRHQLKNVSKFLEMVDLLKTNPDLFHVTYVVQVALNKGIFNESGGYIFWLSKREQPEHYKFASRNQLTNFIFAEHDKYSVDDDPTIQNAYADVLKELEAKGVKIE